jgi:protocatechuate 3,4-dioxygenase beta subunit
MPRVRFLREAQRIAAMRDLSRRTLLAAAAAAGLSPPSVGAEQIPTPACGDDEPTPSQTEGPFFKPRTPMRADLVEPNARAKLAVLEGQIVTRRCRPVANALIELWHADERGAYDNRGFRYRGHILSDASGRYRFRTIVPAIYPGRTRHYHVKIQSPQRRLLTTQLYFPGEALNADDGLFDAALLMRVADSGDALAARFDFVLDMA